MAKNSESWRIAFDFPEELQFASFIAQREGFLIGEAGGAKCQAESEWRTWWMSLTNSRQAVEKSVRQSIDPRTRMEFGPPAFTTMVTVPMLQTLCRKHWPEFHQQWGKVGGQKLLNGREAVESKGFPSLCQDQASRDAQRRVMSQLRRSPVKIPQEIRDLIESGSPAHLVTLNPDGSPQVTLVWVGLDGDEVVAAHLPRNRKVRNIERDRRVALSLEADTKSAMGLTEYAVLYGQARIQEGGAPELLQRLAEVYIGPGVKFPPMDNPPPGYVTRIRVDRIEGVGPWTGRPV